MTPATSRTRDETGNQRDSEKPDYLISGWCLWLVPYVCHFLASFNLLNREMDEGKLLFLSPEFGKKKKTYEKSKREGKRASGNQFAIGYQTLFSSEVSAGYSNKIAVTGTKQGGETCAEEGLGSKQTVSWKWRSCCFKRYHAYSISFNSWNVGEFFWSWILKPDVIAQFRRRNKGRCPCLHVLHKNVKLGSFTSQSRNDSKVMYKRAWSTCKVFVLPI